MTKATIQKMWMAGLMVLVAGLIVGFVGLALMFAYGGHFTPAPSGNGYDFVPTLDGFFWAVVSLMVIGFTVAAAGGVVQLAAWIGALVNTHRMADKTWFLILLIGGLLGLQLGPVGFAVMVAYLLAGPDDMAFHRHEAPTATPGIPSLPAMT